MMIKVIADDITGAAEIAGIAKSAGLNTKLVMVGDSLRNDSSTRHNDCNLRDNECELQDFGCSSEDSYDVVVFATDTRQMNENDAVKEVVNLTREMHQDCLLFKKTDSVLRGHVKAECDAMLANTCYDNVLLIPQNPSKGRVVKDGLYYINDVLLCDTQFAHDPEFPATSADVGRFGVPDAESLEDIFKIVDDAKQNTLFAGGADLFKVVLDRFVLSLKSCQEGNLGNDSRAQISNPVNANHEIADCFLMVCGSTQSKSVIDSPLCRHFNTIESNMPENVFLGNEGAEKWITDLKDVFPEHGVMLTINYPAHGGKDFAVRLRRVMAEVVCALVSDTLRLNLDSSVRLKLIIEGGATAFETLAALGWNDFDVTEEHAPGIVEIKNSKAAIILKPGSYPWNGLLDRIS